MAKKSKVRNRKKTRKKAPPKKRTSRRKTPAKKKRRPEKKSHAPSVRLTGRIEYDAIHGSLDAEDHGHKHEPFDDDFPHDIGGSE